MRQLLLFACVAAVAGQWRESARGMCACVFFFAGDGPAAGLCQIRVKGKNRETGVIQGFCCLVKGGEARQKVLVID